MRFESEPMIFLFDKLIKWQVYIKTQNIQIFRFIIWSETNNLYLGDPEGFLYLHLVPLAWLDDEPPEDVSAVHDWVQT